MNERYNNIFGTTFPISSAAIFNDMVNDLSSLNFTVADADVKGDAFEYFLKNAYQGIKIKDLGEYFTPRNIVRTMVSMVDPKIGEKVYDPFCGTGGFLIEAFRYVALRSSLTPEVERILKFSTVFGSEIAATARVARMNMVLYGDGHSNVYQRDSFASPIDAEYDVLLTNPPFSQKTRHGNLYDIPSHNGDLIAMQHCLRSLKDGGRGAILVKEDFLTKGGAVKRVRDYLLKSVTNVNVVSLPRRLFEPYTPTKTSILSFDKGGSRKPVFFFIVKHVGHTFGARKESTSENDLPVVLDAIGDFNNIRDLDVDYHVASRVDLAKQSQSLWIYDYKEVLPKRKLSGRLERLGDHIKRGSSRFKPSKYEVEEFKILGVRNDIGIYLKETKFGHEFSKSYEGIRVQSGDFVYNPHRVNVGSIGIVPNNLAGGIVPGIYVVFRICDTRQLPPHLLLYQIKSPTYQQVIRAYDSKHGAVRANLTWDQLVRIRIHLPNEDEKDSFLSRYGQVTELRKKADSLESELKQRFID